MKTENKMEQLKAASHDAAIAESAAKNSRDLAWRVCKPNSDNGITPTDSDWEAYRAADEVFMDARAASQRAADIANAYEVGEYEVGEYETNAYEAEDK